MKLLIVSATSFEIAPLTEFLNKYWIEYKPFQYQKGEHSIEILVSGVGIPASIFQLTKKLAAASYDLVLNLGIAGAFDRSIPLGSVWQIVEDRFADIGIEEADGSFRDLFEIELIAEDQPPFQKGILKIKDSDDYNFLPKARAITVNKVHGFPESIEKIKEKYPSDLESMEGAAIFYVALALNQPVLQIRSVSNYVEKRNREQWEIGLAIEQLNLTIIEMLKVLFQL